MANVIECDGGCGARSPDEKGLFVANNWTTVTVDRYVPGPFARRQVRRFHLCAECTAKVTAPISGRGEYAHAD